MPAKTTTATLNTQAGRTLNRMLDIRVTHFEALLMWTCKQHTTLTNHAALGCASARP